MEIDYGCWFLTGKNWFWKENILNVLKEISKIDIGDNVCFQYKNIDTIRQEDEYGGYNITFLGKLENIKEIISIDLATGDPITPSAIDYQYKCLFDNKVLDFKAYNFETILAEKLQTILVRGTSNSRSKDFYDIYIIHKLRWDEINIKTLKEASANTCDYRDTHFTKDGATKIAESINNNIQMKTRWNSYCLRNSYAKGIDLSDTIKILLSVINEIF